MCTLHRYFVRVLIHRKLSNITKERDLWVQKYHILPKVNSSIKMEVGIEDCLHIEFEYQRSKYGLVERGRERERERLK